MSPVSQRKGDAGKCDGLFSKIVRSRGACERCGESRYEKLTTAHIVRRGYSLTRCMEENAWCLCYVCHRETEEPVAFLEWVGQTIGRERYVELLAHANEGQHGNAKLFWRSELVRLNARAAELGLPTRRVGAA